MTAEPLDVLEVAAGTKMPDPWELVIVDSFTREPFAGNPAAVLCLVRGGELTTEAMQRLAAELNLSETAFCVWDGDVMQLRWFTPRVEVDLCGHATLATAKVLLDGQGNDTVSFETRSGTLTVTRGEEGRLVMDFPSRPARQVDAPEGLLPALGLTAAHVKGVGRNVDDYLVEVTEAATVNGLEPDFQALGRIESRGVCVAALADEPYDVVSRFFAPRSGVPEDPVTGSAHTMLAPWFAGRVGDQLRCRQASARGGDLWLHLVGDRVRIAGYAVEVARYPLTQAAVEILSHL